MMTLDIVLFETEPSLFICVCVCEREMCAQYRTAHDISSHAF